MTGWQAPRPEAVSTVIERIYGAASDFSRWNTVLAELAKLFDATSASMVAAEKADGTIIYADGVNLPESYWREYRARFFAIDPRVAYALPRRPGAIYSDARVLPTIKTKRHPFYAEFLPAHELRDGLGCSTINNETLFACVTLHRGLRAEAFQPEHERGFSIFAPHLRQSMQLASRLQWSKAYSDSLSLALDHLPTAVIVVDANANVIGMNSAANTLLGKGDGLSVKGGEIKAARGPENTRLRRAIAAVAGGTEAGLSGNVLQVGRRSGIHNYDVLLSPIHTWGTSHITVPRTGAILMVSDPEAQFRLPIEPLQHLYGLTAAEARLAAALATGQRVESAAAAFKISRETARTQLRQIFQKTGTTRQADLVAKLKALPFSPSDRTRGNGR